MSNKIDHGFYAPANVNFFFLIPIKDQVKNLRDIYRSRHPILFHG